MSWRELMEDIWAILYPPDNRCIFCCSADQKLIYPYQICQRCWGSLPFIRPPQCDICGKPLQDEKQLICRDCVEHGRFFTKARAVFEYMPSVHEVIYRYKYKGQQELSRSLGLLMAYVFESIHWPAMDAIIPVPLHPAKLKQRGYNQSALLARQMGGSLGLPVLDNALRRCRDTKAQVTLDRQQRYANMVGAFIAEAPSLIEGKMLLLIDDILTTGATADACAKALMDAGAGAVYVFTLATGTRK